MSNFLVEKFVPRLSGWHSLESYRVPSSLKSRIASEERSSAHCVPTQNNTPGLADEQLARHHLDDDLSMERSKAYCSESVQKLEENPQEKMSVMKCAIHPGLSDGQLATRCLDSDLSMEQSKAYCSESVQKLVENSQEKMAAMQSKGYCSESVPKPVQNPQEKMPAMKFAINLGLRDGQLASRRLDSDEKRTLLMEHSKGNRDAAKSEEKLAEDPQEKMLVMKFVGNPGLAYEQLVRRHFKSYDGVLLLERSEGNRMESVRTLKGNPQEKISAAKFVENPQMEISRKFVDHQDGMRGNPEEDKASIKKLVEDQEQSGVDEGLVSVEKFVRNTSTNAMNLQKINHSGTTVISRSLDTHARQNTDISPINLSFATTPQVTSTTWYFAYGSNLCPTVFEGRRKMDPWQVFPARLAGYELRFDLKGIPVFEPVFANVRAASPEHETHGAVFRMTHDQLEHLHLTEGGGKSGPYELTLVRVHVYPKGVEFDNVKHGIDSHVIEAYTLVARSYTLLDDFALRATKPSTRYMNIVRRGARSRGLSESWIQKLDQLPENKLPNSILKKLLIMTGMVLATALAFPFFIVCDIRWAFAHRIKFAERRRKHIRTLQTYIWGLWLAIPLRVRSWLHA